MRRPRFRSDIVVLDLEASSPVKGANDVSTSNIIELGAVRLDGKTLEPTGTPFSELVRPRDVPIEPFITEITGITPDMVAARDTFEHVGRRFVEWYGPRNKAILAAFGIYYDLPLLRKEFAAFGLDYRSAFVGGGLDVRSVALMWLARNGHDTSGISVERMLGKMEIVLPGTNFHRALDDARATAEILRYLWGPQGGLGGQ